LAEIIGPAARAARNGVEVSEFQAYLFTVIEPILTFSPGARRLYAPRGRLLRAGELFENPSFADLLEKLAREGEDCFRHGELGEAIARQSARRGGHLTMSDLQSYRVRRRAALKRDYRGHALYLNPAPAAGGPLLAFALALLEQLWPQQATAAGDGAGAGERAGPDALLLARVMELVNEARAEARHELGDFAAPAHVDQYLQRHLRRAAAHPQQERGTTHISVIDASGAAAALTLSNGEGNGLVLEEHGLMLNNMLGEEDLHDCGFHNWRENARLSSMMSPTLMRGPDGSITALGSGGSNRIRSAILQVVSNLVDRKMELNEAVAAARLHVEKCGSLSWEAQPPGGALAGKGGERLRAAWPDARIWPEPNMFFGGVHCARMRSGGELEGAGDPRRDGVCLIV
jgi:gamma-glutamyltranspeptidase/glutathione hydrolase